MNLIFFAILIAYVVVGTIIAMVSKKLFKEKSLSEYYTGGGRFGGILLFAAYAATTYSAFMMIGLVGLAYETGVGALGFELVYLVSTIFLLSTAGFEIWRISRERKWISPSQMLSDLYRSRVLGLIVSMIYLYAMLPYLSAQILGLKAVFSYGGLGKIEALITSALITYAWIFVAGAWSVAATDLYQGILMLFGGLSYLTWVLFSLTPRGGDVATLFTVLGERGYLGITGFWSISVFLAYTLPWAFFSMTNPQVVLRLYYAKDPRSYVNSVRLFFVYGLTYTLIVVLVGLLARSLAERGVVPANLGRDAVTPYLISLMDPVLGSLIAVSIIAAAITTVNGIVLAVSGSIVSVFGKWSTINVARVLDAVLVSIAAVMAYLEIGYIVDLSVLTSVILLPLAPVTLIGVYLRKRIGIYSRSLSVASVLIGAALATYYAYTLGPKKAFIEKIYGLPISALVLLVSTIIITIGVFMDLVKKPRNRINQ